jgi:hypothetical protein
MPVAPTITSPAKRSAWEGNSLPVNITLAYPGKVTSINRPRSVSGSQYTTPRKSIANEVDHVAGLMKNYDYGSGER